MATAFKIEFGKVDKLTEALEAYEGDSEKAINAILHEEAGDLIQEQIKKIMPVSGRHWKGKKAGAKSAKSLKNVVGNLSVTVTTTKNYQYLYFPDDGTSTRRHVGEQYFFYRGGEAAQGEVIDRCINKLINTFEEGVQEE